MKFVVTLCATLAALVLNGAGSASWISYPGDYALWRGNDLQARRIEYGGGYPVFWPSYAPHPLVDFRKDVDLKAPETVEIATEGICRIMGLGLSDPLPGVVSNRFTFPAGKYTIVARVYSQGKPPAICMDGPTVKTDSSWKADWRMAAAWQKGVVSPPAECGGRNKARPSEFALATRPAGPVSQKRIRGDHVFADFGRETFGFLKLNGVRGRGRLRVIYGESEQEALCEEFCGPDQWEYVTVGTDGGNAVSSLRLKVSRGWRYVHVIPEKGVSVEGVAMDEELCPLERVGSFRCSDERLNRIWDVSARTLELTTRELYIEGAKRDRWIWSGDARQSYLMGYYLFGDSRLARDTLFYQRGGDPVVMHINQIMDYTFYWFMSVREYYLYTGDRVFLEQIYDRMASLMDFAIGRLDANGRPHDGPGDWMFIDWAPETLHNTGGVTSFEQMLLVEALETLAEVSETIGRGDAAAYRERAAKLRAEVVPLFWNAEKGALMHLLRDDGTLDPQLTRYPNMFGLACGYFDDAQRESVLKNVIFNDAVMKIQTPYMRFYELDALCRLGLRSRVLDEVRAYWGGMLAEGATSFWELYNPDEKGDAKYAMYNRPFSKSLCHAWGASPLYLFGLYVLGVRPTKPGYAEYVVEPDLGGLEWAEGVVPTPHGPIAVSVRNGVAAATGPAACSGVLRWKGKTTEIARGCGNPVWVAGAEREMNAFYGFSSAFDVQKDESPTLRLSAGSIARVWVNGRFAGYGPARAPEGYMRVDEWPLGDFVKEGRNIIAIEVSNPAINTFYLPERSGYLFAEVVADGKILAATGRDFKAVRLPRVRKTSRFSYQREFSEFYSVSPESYAWRTNDVADAGLPLVEVPPEKPLPRGAPYPTFALDGTFRPVARTVLRRDPARKSVKSRFCVDCAGKGTFKGFAKETLEVNFSDAIQHLVADRVDPITARRDASPHRLGNLEGVVFEGSRNTSGFPKIEVRCKKPTTVWVVMDELAGPDGLPDPVRYYDCVNACGWRLEKPGDYSLESFQPYGFKCVHVVVEGGEAEIRGFDVRTYLNPDVARASFRCSNPALEKVFAAAAQSLACNAVDGFTDCPGRERGVYFGDTVFTARGANVLLCDGQMERTQFENYALAPRFPDVPDGMMPMLYPGDTTIAQAHWIPNFCMWSIVQLADYVRRGGDAEMAKAFRKRAEGVLAWFRRSRNAEGLLENLPGWVFIEWSDADKFTDGVNYPTNMIYIRFLEAFAELYGEDSCRDEAERLRETVRRLSWNGEWFRDHSVRGADGSLETPDGSSEICQYLAFFSGVATAESHSALWRRLVNEMGPMRKADAYPAVCRSNMLFGYSLRFVMLSEAGLSTRVLQEAEHCFLPMAEKTGTLWEAVSTDGFSCCHGFPSLAAWLLAREALGVKWIARGKKRLAVVPPADVPLDWCEGTIPVSPTETVTVRWQKRQGVPVVDYRLPEGWSVSSPQN